MTSPSQPTPPAWAVALDVIEPDMGPIRTKMQLLVYNIDVLGKAHAKAVARYESAELRSQMLASENTELRRKVGELEGKK